MTLKKLNDYQLKGKRVLVRVDLNVPIENGKIADSSRIERILPTIREILDNGGKPILMSHFGRPKGLRDPLLSLEPMVPSLSKILGCAIKFSRNIVGPEALEKSKSLEGNEILLLENTRFHQEEEANELKFSEALSNLGDIYCNDAFSVAHRAHASTVGVAQFIPNCIGLLMSEELSILETVLGDPKRPVVAVVGGAKVSTKLDLLNNLINKVDHLVIGGGMANTFLYAQGNTIGKSLCEQPLKDKAVIILQEAKRKGCNIHIPHDAIISSVFEAHVPFQVVDTRNVPEDSLILDIGPSTCKKICQVFKECKTLIWNGPMGAFELPPFDNGTNITTACAAKLTLNGDLISVAGGGDTVSALKKAGVAKDFTYLSLAGGAFLEWMEGKKLPGISCLN